MKTRTTPRAALLTAAIAAALVAGATRSAEPGTAQSTARNDTGRGAALKRVVSKDGTSIAFEEFGRGPVVILVSSALSDRSSAARLAGLLASRFTVMNYDRRGRGGSGDKPPYAVEREIEDIEALIDHAGGRASLFGSSSGAVLALDAAVRLGPKVSRIAIHEPPFIVDDSRSPIPLDFFGRLKELVAAGRRGEAVEHFMTTAVGVPSEMVGGMRRMPMWAGMEKLAHTLPYDGAIMGGTQAGRPLPADRWKPLTARTLVIDGERSDVFLRNAAREIAALLPGAQRRTLPGQNHGVVFQAPESLAPVLIEFLADAAPGQ